MNLLVHRGEVIRLEGYGQLSETAWNMRLLSRTALDGTTNYAIAGAINPDANADMVLEDECVYWVTSTTESYQTYYHIEKVQLSTGATTTLATAAKPIRSLTRDGSDLYWIEIVDDGYDMGVIKTMPIAGGTVRTVYEAGPLLLLMGPLAVSQGTVIFADVDPDHNQWRLMKVTSPGGLPTVLCPLPDQGDDLPYRIVIKDGIVYWIDRTSVNSIPLSGGSRVVLAEGLSFCRDLLVLDGNVYWSEKKYDQTPGSIKKVPITGGEIVTIATGLDYPMRLAADGPYIYWAESYQQARVVDGRIGRVVKAGGEVETIVSGVGHDTPMFAVDERNVYFADGIFIKKVPRGGSLVAERLASLPVVSITGIATDGRFVYVVDMDSRVWKVPASVGEPVPLVETRGFMGGPITVAGEWIYWGDDAQFIRKVMKDGSGFGTAVGGVAFPSDIVADGQNIFFSEQDTGNIRRVSVDGGTVTTLANGLRYSWNLLALNRDTVYWIDQIHLGWVPKAGGAGGYVVPGGLQTVADYRSGIAADESGVYWSEPRLGVIRKLTLLDAHGNTPITDYTFNTVQKIYMGYYQRPADPGGLRYWARRLDSSNGDLNEIIQAYANSPESRTLYGDINSGNIGAVVDAIYLALFNRHAEPGGLDFYMTGFKDGRFTAATIMLNVLFGAQNDDLQSIDNKLTAANLFTRTIDPELDGLGFLATYAGDGDTTNGRSYLASVTADTATVPSRDQTTAYVRSTIADAGDPILNR